MTKIPLSYSQIYNLVHIKYFFLSHPPFPLLSADLPLFLLADLPFFLSLLLFPFFSQPLFPTLPLFLSAALPLSLSTVLPRSSLLSLHHSSTVWVLSEDVQGRVKEILENLKKVKGQARGQALKELRQVVQAHGTAKKTVVACGGVGLISSLLGPFTTHVVGSEVVGVLVNLNLDFDSKFDLLQLTKISLMVDILNEGSIETKINCTRLIGMLMEGNDSASENVASLSLLVGLLRLVKDKKRLYGVLAGLSSLKKICSHESIYKNNYPFIKIF
ncbi:U-box domain-containing protein 30 [Theobroma cacao]|uniref:U-box domain-containing protein n=1 Tax=Theobroma cacao TaxID=3641 RepID=A0A061EYT2_THECC|nr:U-box domain-containing protein 30 [Theobroma cacao]